MALVTTSAPPASGTYGSLVVIESVSPYGRTLPAVTGSAPCPRDPGHGGIQGAGDSDVSLGRSVGRLLKGGGIRWYRAIGCGGPADLGGQACLGGPTGCGGYAGLGGPTGRGGPAGLGGSESPNVIERVAGS